MKVITVQEGNKLRVVMIPESPADGFMMKALRCADGNQTKVVPVDSLELERVINPYKEAGHANDKSKESVIIELTVDHFPVEGKHEEVIIDTVKTPLS